MTVIHMPCPTCGRSNQDWRDPSRSKFVNGSKDVQRHDSEDRLMAYKRWHRELGRACLATDVDAIEWRVIDGRRRAVAVLELTRADGAINIPSSYLASVADRLTSDFQARAASAVAARLGCDAYVVVFHHTLTEFHVAKLPRIIRWHRYDRRAYAAWVSSLESGIILDAEAQ